MAVRSLVATLLLASSALAKTDLAGCTYTDVVVFPSGRPSYEAYGSRIWYVPGSGELCEFLDCGGGRAPPKTTVPGCPLYSGTETYSPSYLDLHTKAAGEATATATGSSGASTTAVEAQVTTQPTAAPATTLETSVSETASEASTAAAASTTTAAVPVQSSAASSSSSSTATASQGLTTGAPGRNGTVTGSRPTNTFTTNGAAPTGVAVLGSFLVAGVAAVGLL
ncbi:cell wall protein [Trichoderma longibrachiatum]|uniref:Cell wall protein n=1 Tax=Trichoderma longibrachiatum ATCC 18648 TaxID=983965 RepID=A0A2T4C511_TRILO|nr:hypothetical protein M440DRAFT_1401002 [Trichoderma longibrachiatum ATCC 18648]